MRSRPSPSGQDPGLLGVLARTHALLAPSAEAAEPLFLEALSHQRQHAEPFERARTELAYGEFLRRAQRRTEARIQLRDALATFEGLNTPLWADRARAELEATGITARKRDPSTLDTLTPQELRIAKLVAGGASNRDVAAQLFLSPKTVEYHLRKVFLKLGVSSRSNWPTSRCSPRPPAQQTRASASVSRRCAGAGPSRLTCSGSHRRRWSVRAPGLTRSAGAEPAG